MERVSVNVVPKVTLSLAVILPVTPRVPSIFVLPVLLSMVTLGVLPSSARTVVSPLIVRVSEPESPSTTFPSTFKLPVKCAALSPDTSNIVDTVVPLFTSTTNLSVASRPI